MFEQLFQANRQRVYALAYHMMGNADDAADVTQEVFVRMWKHRDALDSAIIGPWLLRVARNVAIDELRKRKARQRRITTDTDLVSEGRDTGQSPENLTMGTLFNERLESALNKLDEPYKSIVILREIEGYKYDEISEVLSLPLNTVKVYLHRARRSLRIHLTEEVRYEYAS